MRLDKSQFWIHAIWATPALFLTVIGGGWYLFACGRTDGEWLGGGSAPGLACGILAGLIIFFEMLLWPRKALRAWRLLPMKHWMSAHIWFGLACVPLAFFHCGMHWGGYLSASLLLLLLATVVSGLYGLVVQNLLPLWMLHNLPAETIYTQIDNVSRQNVEDAQRMLLSTFGPREAEGQSLIETPENELEAEQTVLVGATAQRGRMTGRVLRTSSLIADRDDRVFFWDAFDQLRPFLLKGHKSEGVVADFVSATNRIDQLRKQSRRESHEVVVALENLCEQRRQFDIQTRMHRWLHGWLPVHVAISVILSGLLVIHIFVALRYW